MSEAATSMSEDHPPAGTRLSLLLVISITAAWFLGQMGYYAQAQLLGPLMSRFELGEAPLGIMMSQETTVYALSLLLLAGPLSRVSRVKVAFLGGCVLIVMNLISGYTDNFEVLRAARLAAGFGAAMLGAAGTTAAASSMNPQRVFAIITVSWGLIAAVQPMLLPYLTVPYGASGGYYGMAAATVVILPLCMWLIPPRRSEPSAGPVSLSPIQRLAQRLGVLGAPNAKYALFVMGALFVYEIGQGTTQVFLEQFGLRAGMEEYGIGKVMGISAFLGLFGGVIAAWLGTRYGNIRPVTIGIILNAVFAAGLAISNTPFLYGALYLLWNAAYYFMMPYMMGILAEMDDRGRWAVAVDALWWLGAAPGAAVAGLVFQAGGYSGLFAIPLIAGFACLVVLIQVLRKFYASQEK